MMDRRRFLKFAGITGIVGATDALITRSKAALAGSWYRLTAKTQNAVRKPQSICGRQNSLTIKNRSSFAITSDGSLYSCGYNSVGNLGINVGTGSRNTFVKAIGISNAISVDFSEMNGSTAIALRSDGLVFTTGSNANGILGGGWYGTPYRSTFIQASGISNAIAVAMGVNHSVALRSDGMVFACGYNKYGEVGNGFTFTSHSTFVMATGISNAIAISAGGNFTMALRADGRVFASGLNSNGGAGNNSAIDVSTFVMATGISNAIAVAMGAAAVALRSDGNVFACGGNAWGQLGNNSTAARSTYVQCTGISNAIAIAAGYHTVALRADGTVWGCGNNSKGALGNNSTVNKSTFVQATGISNAIAIAAGYYTTLALRSDGLVFACGYNSVGQLGDNSTIDKSTFVQITI
jgi:alpha-tubulin suppressor-like RCC1 family protein